MNLKSRLALLIVVLCLALAVPGLTWSGGADILIGGGAVKTENGKKPPDPDTCGLSDGPTLHTTRGPAVPFQRRERQSNWSAWLRDLIGWLLGQRPGLF